MMVVSVRSSRNYEDILRSATLEEVVSGDFDGLVASNSESRYAGIEPGRGYPFISEGSIVEPFMETRFHLAAGNALLNEKMDIQWTIERKLEDATMILEETTTNDPFLDVTIDFVGDIKVTAKAGDVKVQRSFLSRYVRRNIRGLSEEARNSYFDANKIVAVTSGPDGKREYGDDFEPLTYFVKIHLNAAGGRKTDKFHDGLGFVTQHCALTDAFETSLRAIDPKLSVPYWSYTEDSAHMKDKFDGDPAALWTFDVWQDDWFGNASGSRFHTVEQGRFAYMRVEIDFSNDIHNPYGFLRSPWNMNN